MFDHFLSKRGGAPIYEQINEYTYWKSQRHPLIAGAQRALLHRLADSFNLNSIEDLTESHIALFTGEQLTGFYIEKAFQALRGFLQYASMAGYNCISYKTATNEHMSKVGRPVQWDMVERVRDMREYGLSNETISKLLTQSLKKRVHKKSVDRWKKRIPELNGAGK
jgi:hypothetical protein